jgi:hypothetical protein
MTLLEQWIDNCGAEQERWFLHDSDLDPIRDHRRYQSLLDRFKQRQQAPMPGPEVSAT